MRTLTWLLLMGLVAVSIAVGQAGVALGLAGVKALLLGREFMELKHAHPVHSWCFTAAVSFAALVLWLLLR